VLFRRRKNPGRQPKKWIENIKEDNG